MKLGWKWLPAGDQEPNPGRNMEAAMPRQCLLPEALMSKKMEFTEQEWEAFGIKKGCLRTDHFIKSGDSFFQPDPASFDVGDVTWRCCLVREAVLDGTLSLSLSLSLALSRSLALSLSLSLIYIHIHTYGIQTHTDTHLYTCMHAYSTPYNALYIKKY